MAKLSNDELLDAFKEMTLLELSDFVKAFEETFEVTAAAPVAVAAPGAAPAAAEAAEEQSEFDVILEADHQQVTEPKMVADAVHAAAQRGDDTILLLVKHGGQDRFLAVPLKRA